MRMGIPNQFGIKRTTHPSYLDCRPDCVVIHPGDKLLTWEDVQRPTNALVELLDKIQANTNREHLVIWARPGSVKVFRAMQRKASQRWIDVEAELIDADFRPDWDAQRNAVGSYNPVQP